MKKNNLQMTMFLLLMICFSMIMPGMNVKAETSKKFSVAVETDKAEYNNGDIVEYKIKVKNIHIDESKNLIVTDELPDNISIVETDGEIDGKSIVWKKDSLDRNEEAVFYLKAQIKNAEEPLTDKSSDDNADSDSNIINPEVNENDESKADNNRPNLFATGDKNVVILIGAILVIAAIGCIVFRGKSRKAKTALILVFVITSSLISFDTIAMALDTPVNEMVEHTVNIGDSSITSKIKIKAVLPENSLSNPENPKWDMDTDGDGVTDAEEEIIGTNKEAKDTDGDGLLDKFELEIGLNPLSNDTDGNGILDANEDLDQDGLNNLEEQSIGTSPLVDDTDGDTISDYDEIYTYKTNPLLEDTDGDGLTDNMELQLGTDPNKNDSNNNGINDGDERYDSIIKLREYEKDINIDVSLSGSIKGSLIDEIKISNMEGVYSDINEVVQGLIISSFRTALYKEGASEKAELKFVINEDKITEFEAVKLVLCVYNKESKKLDAIGEFVDNEITIDTELANDYKEYVIVAEGSLNESVRRGLVNGIKENAQVDNNLLLKFADLSYKKLKNEYVGKKVSEVEAEIGNNKYVDAVSRADMDTWTVVEVNNGNGNFGGFGAIAVKKGRNLIVSFAGTGVSTVDIPDFIADLGILTNTNYQTNLAKEFMRKVLTKCRGDIDNVYISGHSLGGYLAQYTVYQCVENTFFNKLLMRNIKCKSVTYNSPNFVTPSGVKGILESPGIIDNIIISIPSVYKKIFFEYGKYKDYNLNYYIDGDKVSGIGKFYLGKRVPLENLLNGMEGQGSHDLYNFYKHDLSKVS